MSCTGTRLLVSLRTNSLRCLLGDGLRGEGLGIPHHLLWCHSSCLQQEWSLASAVFFLVLFVVGDLEWVGFFWLLGGERGAGESGSAVRGCDLGRLDSSGCCLANGAFERRLLASVGDVSVIMQLKFQQSLVEFYKVPQLSCFTETRLTVQTVQYRRFHSAVLCEGLDMPVLCVSKQCKKPWTFSLLQVLTWWSTSLLCSSCSWVVQFLDKVVDTPVGVQLLVR